MKIDCTKCAMYHSEHCDDCLVTALLRPPGSTVEVDDALEASLGALSGGGLVPVLRFKPRPEGDPGAQPSDLASEADRRAG